MELLLYAGLFYAWQCLAFVPADAVIFDSGLWRAHHRRGGGVRWLNPWPGALGLVTQGLPFIVDDDGVLSFLPAGWRSRPLIPPSRRTARWDQLVGAVAAGCRVRVAGKVFVRGASPRHTRNLAALLARLGKAQSKPRRALKKELGRSFSGQRAVRRLAEAKAASRWLDLWCGVYLLTLALALPALMWRWGELNGFLLLVPWIVLIHLLATGAVYRAHRRLALGGRGARWELVISSLLFPPALLRTPQLLRSEALAQHHPAAVARALLAPPELADYLRHELALLARAAEEGEGGELDDSVEELLFRLGEEAGLTRLEISRGRRRVDPVAAGYCPLCLADLRLGFERCIPCRSPVVPYAEAGGGG